MIISAMTICMSYAARFMRSTIIPSRLKPDLFSAARRPGRSCLLQTKESIMMSL